MELKQILVKLNRARRALDSLSQVRIIDDWKFDNDLGVWYLHLSIEIKYASSYFPLISQWYFVVDPKYPIGRIKVYPDVENSITVTLQHQSNNSKIEKNGLWRKGAICLEVNTISQRFSEPYNIDERLLYHAKRAICWLELAAKGELITKSEPFELPEFSHSNILDMKFVFSEDMVTFMQWESTECKYGLAELDVYKSNPNIYYVKLFKSVDKNIEHYTEWGKYLSKTYISPPIIAPWILLNEIPVVNEWQAPETFGELLAACEKQNINLMQILQNICANIRDGRRHLLLIGFPVPRFFGGEFEIISWKALYLPILSFGTKAAKGFRNNQKGWWMRDKIELFTKNAKIDWIISENWNQHEISQRGKLSDLLTRKRVLIIGAGCIGASIAEMLVRGGVYDITIADSDIFEVGNLSRHILNLNNIGELKELSVCNYLNSLSPHANVNAINDTLSIDDSFKTNIDLDRYDIIIDCTGEDGVLDIFQNITFTRSHIMASVSVGLGAKRMYITLMRGCSFDFSSFFNLIFPYLQKEKSSYDDFALPRDGIGCWHPTFPGRTDDIWLAASTSVKAIENYIISESPKNLSLIYEQKEGNDVFEGYEVVDKQEDE